MTSKSLIPREFFWRRMHSLMGVWLVLFLIEHLLTNSQAALWITDDGSGFVRAVNAIQNLPYIHVIEIALLAVPFFIHIVWGIQYLLTARSNSSPSDGSTPSLPEYPRNHAYTWQRITSWILIIGILGHVVQMRFIDYPEHAKIDSENYYMARVSLDEGLYTVASRLNVKLYDAKMIEMQRETYQEKEVTLLSSGFWISVGDFFKDMFTSASSESLDEKKRIQLIKEQVEHQQKEFIAALQKRPLGPGQVMAVAPDFGTAELLIVRDTFKSPLMIVLYSFLVLFTVFHAFNGLWTASITWGITLTDRAQSVLRTLTTLLMLLTAFLGLAAIWGTYFITLKS